jgi:putative membrane protein
MPTCETLEVVNACHRVRRRLTTAAGRIQESSMIKQPAASTLALACLVGMLTAPAWALSLAATNPPQPLPDGAANYPEPVPLENWSGRESKGSAALVPLMAADMQASQASTADMPADAAGGTPGKSIDDLAFVKQAAESGRKEISSARNALPQLKKPELKRLAEMLVNDHGNANARLAKIAESKGWPVVAATPASEPASAGTASGDFDARWTAEMIAGHERSVALYRAQAQAGEDPDLRRYARDMLPTIEHHLEELRSLQK